MLYEVEFTRSVEQSGTVFVGANSPKEAEELAKKRLAERGEPDDVQEVNWEEWEFNEVLDGGEGEEDELTPTRTAPEQPTGKSANLLEWERGLADAQAGQASSDTGEYYLKGYRSGSRG
jgi:hypothetical protein